MISFHGNIIIDRCVIGLFNPVQNRITDVGYAVGLLQTYGRFRIQSIMALKNNNHNSFHMVVPLSLLLLRLVPVAELEGDDPRLDVGPGQVHPQRPRAARHLDTRR